MGLCLDLIKSDILLMYPDKKNRFFRLLVNPAFHAVFLLRLAQFATPRSFWLWRNILIAKHGIDVGGGFYAGPGLRLPHPTGIVIGGGVKLGAGVRLYQNVTIGSSGKGYPKIGDNVIVYPNSVVVGDIEIGPGVIIGACSFVDKTLDAGYVFRRH